MTARPADGTAVILHLIEAVRGWRAESFVTSDSLDTHQRMARWVDELEKYIEQAAPAEPAGWEPRRWRELVEGDRVSVGGVEAEVLGVQTQRWHVDPRSSEYRPQPLEHDITRVRLSFRPDQPYDMRQPDNEVETLRGERGQEIDRRAGRGRQELEAARAEMVGHWAEEAALTLAAAGLQPEEVK